MEIYNIDLHYHAGQERMGGKTLADHISHASATGRRVLGITDHINLYIPSDDARVLPYPRSTEGLAVYRRELEEQKSGHQEMSLYFAPELSPSYNFKKMPREIIEMSDYFICEPGGPLGSIEVNTKNRVSRLAEIAELKRLTGRPAFMAHPMRSLIYRRLCPDGGRLRPEGIPAPRGSFRDFSAEDASLELGLDLMAFGEEAACLGVPIEVNGETQSRARSVSNPGWIQVIWAAYAALKSAGAELIPSSDQHDYKPGKAGTPVPQDCFDALGIKASDINFVKALGAPRRYK